MSPDPFCLCRFTGSVSRLHRCPRYGADPFGWLDTAIDVYRRGRCDVLFPTQEQVAVLAWARSRLDAAGIVTIVPPFPALAAVQDKISAWATLDRLGIPQPESATEIWGWRNFPAFVKDPIGTASGGVRRVTDRGQLERAAGDRRVLVQAAVDGPLVMCQAVFDAGSLVAFHATERTAEGAGGGASHKRSRRLPVARHWFELLGAELGWHGALSADLILSVDGPVLIDINPRLVEPQNAHLAGVDLIDSMLQLATGAHPAAQPDGRAGVATHQLLLAVLGAAQHGRGRRGVIAELFRAVSGRGGYSRSTEELTPVGHDLRAAIPVAVATAATVLAPGSWSWFTGGSVADYALSQQGWQDILDAGTACQGLPGRSP